MHDLRVKTILSQEIADLDVYGSRVNGLLRKCSLWFPGLQLNGYCKIVHLDGYLENSIGFNPTGGP